MYIPVRGNDGDAVAGRYALGEQSIGEVLNPLSPGASSVPVLVNALQPESLTRLQRNIRRGARHPDGE